ncbi:hypothetical protein OSCT_2215 [Oscillochloris trichoides DG-6]|uniref:Uncharacterized protein n=1 Tax=Oscillochloris trichoides DG-6 TaxID=765420 RepID=E1IFW4_9CHLR|nr:hypothetical protein [Oscillochloris trichoides]EFO79922.1 hypothetical protein OSCT_2215 [Oscillochloris trichoides DG-6]
MSTLIPDQPLLVAYDRTRVRELLRNTTAQSLHDALRTGTFGANLSPVERAELDALLTAWMQRALGYVFLRDALLVDAQRGPRVFDLICAELTSEQLELSPDLAAALRGRDLSSLTPTDLAALHVHAAAVSRITEHAQRSGLHLALLEAAGSYPLPDDLDRLLPSIPLHLPRAEDYFVPPTGLRRWVAVTLAVAGILLLLIPILSGTIPKHPAGLPLALITLALMVGIKAGWAGYCGALCLWLVPNMPGFRSDRHLTELLPYVPLLLGGVALLIYDRRVRALWAWLRGHFGLGL